jgi:O-antigen/teichoic acid export membrane protein
MSSTVQETRPSQGRLFVGRLSRLLISSTSLNASLVFGLSGGAFALGNILLARHLPVAEFGKFGLVMALFLITSQVAPLGIDQLMLRRRIDPSFLLFGRFLGQGALVALAVGILAHVFYDLGLTSILLLSVAIGAGNLIWIVAAGYRSHHKQLAALLAQNACNWLLLAISVLILFVPGGDALLPMSLYCGGMALIGVAAWAGYARRFRVPPSEREQITLQAAAPLLGIAVGGVVAVQLERIVIPLLLDVYALALFNVLTSVAIFPFRMVASGAGFALVPRLRAASSVGERKRLVWHEVRMIALALVGATVFVALLAAPVAEWLTAGRYAPGLLLVLAACANGAAKVVQAIPRAVVTACGSERDVTVLNRLVWVGILAGVAGACVGSWTGLAGLLVGSTLGSLIVAIPATRVAQRALVAGSTAESRPSELPVGEEAD